MTNGSLDERLQMDTLDMEILTFLDEVPRQRIANDKITNIEKSYNDSSSQIHINITDDVDDEAVYGRNRHRHKPRGRSY